jgi:hypothetical protein
MEKPTDRFPSPVSVVRVALAVFVLAWIFGPYALQAAVPIWLAFVIALGVELSFFAGALRAGSERRTGSGPQTVDRDRYGYMGDSDDLLLVREGGEELWIPYSGETDEELQALIAAAREADEDEEAAAALGVREPWPLWPRVRRFVVGLGVIGSLALILWFAENRIGWNALNGETRAEAAARFSEEASRIAEKPVTIRCDEGGDYVGAVQHADGVAVVGGDLAYLTPARCLDLYRLAFKGEVKSSQTGRALAVLAHESWHLRGIGDEGTTECYALQTGVELGQRLGLSEGTARQMMRQQLTENGLHSGASPEYLVSPDCRDGGRLDLNPDSSSFP